MKRLSSSVSLAPFCPSGWLDEEEEMVDGSLAQAGEKKRRLGADQVKVLEKNFEVENKLEPERKARLAQELGLQPRQVAVWFQNRRARRKTKHLERDCSALKLKYDALQVEYEAMVRYRDSLLAEVKSLKANLTGDEEECFSSIIKEAVVSDHDNKPNIKEEEETETVPLVYKDGSTDSDSSAVLNDHETSPLISFAANTNLVLNDHETSPLISFTTNTNSSFSSLVIYNQNLLKVEDDDEFLVRDSSSFFHDEQAPMLSWYCGGGWE